MRINKLPCLLAVVVCISQESFGDTLTFVPRQDIGGAFDYNWFSAANWFSTDAAGNLIPAGRVPQANETALITGLVDAGSSGVRIQTLIATNNATISGGTFAIENLQMLGGSSFSNATVNILVTMTATGTNCTLRGTTLSILGIAAGTFVATTPSTPTFVLKQGSLLQVGGSLSLTDGFELSAGDLPQSKLVIATGGVMSFGNSAIVLGTSNSHLLFDNSGTVRAESGTVTFRDSIDWQCGGGLEEFNAATPSAMIVFEGPFQVPTGATSIFSGPGLSLFAAGGTINGTAQLGSLDGVTQLFTPGNLEAADSLAGAGSVHVLGGASQGSVLSWTNGTLGLMSVNVDLGSELRISGGAGTSRQLSGCIINNSGLCSLRSGGLGLNQGAAISNLLGATFEIDADGAFTGTSFPAGGIFNNAGTFLKISSGITQFGTIGSLQGPDFNNSGLVDIGSGQLNLLGGVSSGTFNTASNAVLWFWGSTHVLNAGTTFTGTGPVRLLEGVSGATWLLTGGIAIPELEVGSNGIIEGPGSPSTNLIQIGTLLASDNAALNNGDFEVQDGQLLDSAIVLGSAFNVLHALTISGTNCTLSGTTLTIPTKASAMFIPQLPSAGATLNLGQGSVIQNAGLIALANGSRISGGGLPQSSLVLQPDGVLDATNSALIQGATNGHFIIDNSGVIRTGAGSLHFQDGIDWQCRAGLGEFRADNSGSMVFDGPFQVPSGTTILFTGAGTNRLSVGATVDGTAQVGGIDQSTHLFDAGLLQTAGGLSGAGSVHILAGAAQPAVFAWEDGALTVKAINIDSNAEMVISGGSGSTHQLSGCVINNSGSCRWLSPGIVAAGPGAFFNNLAGGRLDIQTDAALTSNVSGPLFAISNAGSFLKSGGNGTSTIMADLNNSGIIEIGAGNLALAGALLQTLGSTVVDAGATFGASILNLQGGSLAGTGTIAAPVNNSAVLSPGGLPGILTLQQGKDYQQTGAGSLHVELGGTSPSAQYDQLAVGGNASLNGRLEVLLFGGFVPHPGDQFEIVKCNSLAGSFSSIDAPPPAGTAWVVRYGVTNVTLVLASEVTLIQQGLSGGMLRLAFSTTSGLSYVVQTSDTLNSPKWQTLTTLDGDGTFKTITDAVTQDQRFYRILIQ